MQYYSLNHHSPVVDFKAATISGQAPDKGLYFPKHIPLVDTELIRNIENIPNEDIAFRVIRPYVGDAIAESDLYDIVKETIDFPIPLVQVDNNIFSLELFHGPTLAFKDVGARFMSRCLGEFVKGENNKVIVLVATSGDTGGAVANGFYDVQGVEVVILYPSGKVSPVQELQLTALGKNIHALEVEGTFDDCQAMVKLAFMDQDINDHIFLTSANSINIARWLPQQFYYFFAYKQWKEKDKPPVIAVPSGNFGNICAGLLAYNSGLPVQHFIAACNVNDVVPEYLKEGVYTAKKATATYSNAMDVGDPSNFIRIMELFGRKYEDIKSVLSATSTSDEETVKTIEQVYREQHYMLDPHGAVGYHALKEYLHGHPGVKGIFLETAHPVKFPEVVESAISHKIDVPASVQSLMDQNKRSTIINADFKLLKNYLINFK